MGIAEASNWTIDSIQCSSWKYANDIASIEISNFAMDSVSFQVVRTPDGDIVPFNSASNFHSKDWYLWTSEADAVDSILLLVDRELNEWQANLDIARQWVNEDNWLVKRGQPVDEAVWAGLAYLFNLRASKYESKIVEALAEDMNVSTLLAKERVRKIRDKGFLSIAGKGNAGEGVITTSAIEILIEKGLIK